MSNEQETQNTEEPPETETETQPTTTEAQEKSLLTQNAAPEEGEVEIEGEDFTPLELEAIKEFLPEGFDVSDDALTSFQAVAAEHKLGEGAVKALIEVQQTTMQEAAKATADAWNAAQTAMQKEMRNDPDVGGDHLAENLARAKTVLTDYGSDELLSLIDTTGAGNSVHLVKFLVGIAEALPQEGTPHTGSPPADKRTLADKMFGGI